jgi:hypothetical protein
MKHLLDDFCKLYDCKIESIMIDNVVVDSNNIDTIRYLLRLNPEDEPRKFTMELTFSGK